jgi:hypothetical protein
VIDVRTAVSDVVLGGFVRMMFGLRMMAVRQMRVIAGFVVVNGVAVMPRGLIVVFRGLALMIHFEIRRG